MGRGKLFSWSSVVGIVAERKRVVTVLMASVR
jgi:hypothetical protein